MAKDAVQETFISLYVNAKKIKDYKKLKSWLVIVLINNCNKLMRDFYITFYYYNKKKIIYI